MHRPHIVAIEQKGALGDVVAALPMAGLLKRTYPDVRVIFIARTYAQVVIESCAHVDEFIDSEAMLADPALLGRKQVDTFITPFLFQEYGLAARAAGVEVRVGNLRRLRTLKWANRFIFQGTRGSLRHVANMNLRYLRPLGIKAELDTAQLAALMALTRLPPLNSDLASALDPQRFNLVLHPKSNRNAREWPAAHFQRLVELLPEARYRVILTGSPAEREQMVKECPQLLSRPGVADLMGRTDMGQLMALLGRAGGAVVNSTGPLHLAAALGLPVIGLFPGRAESIARWRPIGARAEAVYARTDCKPGPGHCPKDFNGGDCACMFAITPERIAGLVEAWPKPASPPSMAA